MEISEVMRNTPITLCRCNGAMTSRARAPVLSGQISAESLNKLWMEWVQEESRRRLGFSAFVGIRVSLTKKANFRLSNHQLL